MFRSIINDIRFQFQTGNTITRLIIINVVIFLAIILVKLVTMISGGFSQHNDVFDSIKPYIFLNQDIMWDLKHPWVFFTHMFAHEGFFHIVINMLILYWFGRIAGDLLGDHRMLPLYLFSGLTGAVIYLLTAHLMYPSSTLNGASGAIMGIVAAAGMTAPDYQMRLLFFGDVKLKFIVCGLLVMYLVLFASLENAGGQMAHFGGAAFGFLYVHLLRQGYDLTKGFRKLLTVFRKPAFTPKQPTKRKVPMEVRSGNGPRQREMKPPPSGSFMGEQERIDYILEKIKKSGFSSLSEEEKKFLDDASQK